MEIITTHLSADFDALASILAAAKLYPDAAIVFSGSMEKNVRDFLYATPYSFHFEKLKNISPDDVDTLIIVDTRYASRIGKFSKLLNKPGVKVHVYDHHPSDRGRITGEVEVVRERGATTTIFVELLRERGILISPDEATILILGIYEDTGLFVFTSTRSEDLEAAAWLLKQGADLNKVSDYINRELTEEQVVLLNDLIHNLEIHDINGVSIAITTSTTNEYVGDLAVLTRRVKEIKGLNVLIVLVRMEKRIHMVLRSRIEGVDVGDIAGEFNGGGHIAAASASIKNMTLPQAKEALILALREKVSPVKLSREIMSSPVKFIERRDTMGMAKDMMTRYNINTLPVLENGKPLGLITRQIVEKTFHHDLKSSAVEDFMINEVFSIHVDSPCQMADEIIVFEKQKIVPVVNSNGLVEGVISRGDMLRVIYGDMLKKPGHILGNDGRSRRYSFTKNVTKVVKDRLKNETIALLEVIAKLGDEQGVSVNLIGGIVRDLLLGKKTIDLDIVVEGDGIAFAGKLASRLSGRARSHEKFKTAVVLLSNGDKIDIASARVEYYDHPAALPTVEMSSLKHDLYRRDFTINALAIRLNGPEAFRLIDFFGGQRDLREKVIRVIHNLSFVEDPTRIFRAIRFEQRFNFTIGKQTLTLIKGAVRRNLYNHLSGRRLFLELLQILKERHPVRSIRRIRELGMLKFIHPGIRFDTSDEEFFAKIREAIAWHRLLYTGKEPKTWFIYLLGLGDGLKEEDIPVFCDNLCLPERYRKDFIIGRKAVKTALSRLLTERELPPSRLYEILINIPIEFLLYMTAKTEKDRIRKEIAYFINRLSGIVIEITGEDLKGIGVHEGPEIGIILTAVRDAKLNGEIKTKEDELGFAKERIGEGIRERCNT